MQSVLMGWCATGLPFYLLVRVPCVLGTGKSHQRTYTIFLRGSFSEKHDPPSAPNTTRVLSFCSRQATPRGYHISHRECAALHEHHVSTVSAATPCSSWFIIEPVEACSLSSMTERGLTPGRATRQRNSAHSATCSCSLPHGDSSRFALSAACPSPLLSQHEVCPGRCFPSVVCDRSFLSTLVLGCCLSVYCPDGFPDGCFEEEGEDGCCREYSGRRYTECLTRSRIADIFVAQPCKQQAPVGDR